MTKKFCSFIDARKYARKLGLTSQSEWRKFSRSSKRPEFIPSNPYDKYRNNGWTSWGDFLGTGTIANQNIQWKPFAMAKQFVHSIKLKSKDDWFQYCKSKRKPNDIPVTPDRIYKKEWKGWGNWLGTGRMANQNRRYRKFSEAKQFARNLGLKTHDQWVQFAKSRNKPTDIPANPWQTYKKEWNGIGDWLGTGSIAPKDIEFLAFNEARDFIRSLGLKGRQDWHRFLRSGKRPTNIPSVPERTYRDEWKGWGDWFGTGTIATFNLEYLSFEEAREEARRYAKKYNIKTWADWKKAKKSGIIPSDIPLLPDRVYSKKRILKKKGKMQ